MWAEALSIPPLKVSVSGASITDWSVLVPAVDAEPLASDEGGEVGGEEQDGSGHVFRCAQAPQGGPCDDAGFVLLGCTLPVGKAGGDDVDADAARADVLREHGGKVDQPRLGRPVGGMPGGGTVASAGGDEDSATA